LYDPASPNARQTPESYVEDTVFAAPNPARLTFGILYTRMTRGQDVRCPPQKAKPAWNWEVRMKVRELLLKKGTRIISLRMNETVERAARMLREENVGALVVKDVCNSEGDTIVGMFSERDFLRAVVDKGPAILKQPVSRLMTPKVVACSSRDDVSHAVALFNTHQIRHLPVIDEHTLIGVISMRDVVAVSELVAA